MMGSPPAPGVEGSVETELAVLDEQGYVVLESVLSAEELTGLRDALEPHLAAGPHGRNDFEGYRSKRVYALLAKSPVFADLVIHSRVLALLDRTLLSNYLLSAALAIHLEPGETAQTLHYDDAFFRLPRPRPAFGLSAIWAIDDFTAENGATEVLPGSHRWGGEVPDEDDPRIAPVVMPAGSVVVFSATLWHRGGANRSDAPRLAITPQYCEGWCRQQENMALSVPLEVAAELPRRAQELLGYRIQPPFMGHVNGMHPARLVDADYRDRERVDAQVAAELLQRPV
jgi:ectoine hydroxylase-related dioxygenase (phytanoyl-CoA dioxygenase family)